QAKPLIVSGDAVLCFGMLEGAGRVAAERAVYDPQSPLGPVPFEASGSKAEKLALVLNGREAALMTGSHRLSLDETAARLFKTARPAVIVIKRGTHGAVI